MAMRLVFVKELARMKRLFRGLAGAGVSLCLLAGCAADPAVKSWWTLREADLRQFQPAKTTKAEVRAALGRPELEMAFPRQGEEVWDFRYMDGATFMLAWVYFDARGLYKYYTSQPDPARYNADGFN